MVFHNGDKPVHLRDYLLKSKVDEEHIIRLEQALNNGPKDRIGTINSYRLRDYVEQIQERKRIENRKAPRIARRHAGKKERQVLQYWLAQAGEQSNLPDLNPYKLDLGDLFSLMNNRLACVFEAVNPSLDESLPLGFNKHGEQHVTNVTLQTLALLRIRQHLLYGGKVPLERQKEEHAILARGTAIGMGHDVGNLLNRDNHEALSPAILGTLIPELLCDAHEWDRITQGIAFHNDSLIELVFAAHGFTTRAEEINWLRDNLWPDALAVLVSDISQSVGRDRVSDKPDTRAAVDADRHLALSLLFQYGELSLSEDGKHMLCPLDFTPGLSKEEEARYSQFARGKANQVVVPTHTHQIHSEYGIPHLFTEDSDLKHVFFDKIVLMVEAAFALFPTLEIFDFQTTDRVPGSQGGTIIIERISRAGIEADIAQLKLKYVTKEAKQDGN
jgi:hypothetical protein